MLGPQRFKQSNHQRTLQGIHTQRNFTQTSRSNHIFQIRCQGWILEHTLRHHIFLPHHIQHTQGRYRFFHMPFGSKISQDIFQMRMDQITNRLPGVIAIHNDIYIYGKTQEQYDKHLLQLLKIASKNGLVFNSRKCHISKPQIILYRTMFSAQGMKPDPIKIQALQDLPMPQNQKQLQSFLGLVNYLQPFLPDIAAKTTFLREQVSQWDWIPSTDSAFQ